MKTKRMYRSLSESRGIRTAALLIVLGGIIMLTGCHRGTWVKLNQEEYLPSLSNQFAAYEGRSVLLATIENKADNTTTWYYYSPNQSIGYEAWPTLQSYFWYCLQKALQKAGMNVYENEPPENVPEMDITLNSITDQEFSYDVQLQKGGEKVFLKGYKVSEDPTDPNAADALVPRAYKMIDKMVEQVLLDKEFKKAFLEVSSRKR
ncbi:MAG: hypothetical protein PHE84_04620 [bacterium]|nr:hypothetical protein [bacterium]